MAQNSRKRLPRAEREQRMLDAAREHFGRDGFQDASMDAIAEDSGITKALLYHYFATKRGLYEATLERERRRLFEDLEAALARAEPGVGQLQAYIEGYFDHIEANRGSWWLIYGDAEGDAVNAMRERNAEAIKAALVDGLAAIGRSVEATTLDALAHYLTGAGEQTGRWWMRHPDVPKETIVQQVLIMAGSAILTLTAEHGCAP